MFKESAIIRKGVENSNNKESAKEKPQKPIEPGSAEDLENEIDKATKEIEEGKESKEANQNERKFAALFEAYSSWAKRREASGKDVDILEFIKLEDISKIDTNLSIEEFQRYVIEKEKPVKLSREAMLKKVDICGNLREEAHRALAEIGKIDPYVSDIKMLKYETAYCKWFDDQISRIGTIRYLQENNAMAFSWLFTKFWDGQGKIEKWKASLNKKRMGELEHAFTLKAVSKKMENLIVLMDRSENVKEVQFYNKELKKYLAFFVEWNNEFQRLHRIDDEHTVANFEIEQVYQRISELTSEFDKILINEKYEKKEDASGENYQEKSKNNKLDLTEKQNNEKNDICQGFLISTDNRISDCERTISGPWIEKIKNKAKKDKLSLEKEKEIIIKIKRTKNMERLEALISKAIEMEMSGLASRLGQFMESIESDDSVKKNERE